MKKALVNTRVSVKLRKSEYRDEWYLYVESYPVFQSGKDTPQKLPIISAVIIQLGTWLFFDMYDPVFLRYTAVYLCIGVLTMLITNYIKRK